ncbi:hypothetical protein TKV_c18230 [Thermoanaerobacter kivui]|uniref:Uncharacterized protein n=1 Tax=Thermoanaerobacter kivui TaxID=2325 RepID=A0A097AT37_THEKI|nr:HEAT repeat domain-containing protein [Thermoanaerobacter kivui]AIS52973.1 hypothetical protein TKV_c18230 [Thermoanaerobacter kivui]
MGIDWKALLLENKDSFMNISKEVIDDGMEYLGAKRVKRKEKPFKKDLFNYYINEINAKIIGGKIQRINFTDESLLGSLEKDIIELGKNILSEGQNPIEMIVYSTKGLDLKQDEIFKCMVRILKNISNNSLEARKALITILEEWHWEDQIRLVVHTLREIKEVNAYDQLVLLLEDDNLKEIAAEALIDLGELRAITPILEMVNSLNGFNSKERGIAFRILMKLIQLGDNAVKQVIERYLDNENKSLNIVYSNVIARLKEEAVENMASLLYDERYSQKAAITLGKMRTSVATDYLLKAYYDPQIKNKANVIIGLGYSKDERCINLLLEILKDENQPNEVKACAITSLANIQAFETKSVIKQFIQNSSLCINAYSALVQLGEIKYLSNLFYYIVKPGLSNEDVVNAIKEIKRLRGLKINDINSQIIDGIKYIIKNDDGYACVNTLKIIDTNLDEEMAKELVWKLRNTTKEEIQYLIYKMLGKHAKALKNVIDEKIFRDAAESDSARIRYLAQKIIEENYKDVDKLIRM